MATSPNTHDTALLLVAHGSSENPDSFASVDAHAERLRESGRFSSVQVGYFRQEPAMGEVFEALSETKIVVVPMLMSMGYFASKVFPRELGLAHPAWNEAQQVGHRRVIYTKPIGTHPKLVDVVEDCAHQQLQDRPDELAQTTLVVAGHGTPRHNRSTDTVNAIVAQVDQRGGFAAVYEAFVDDVPALDEVLTRVSTPNVVVVPCFVADGPHVTEDIPAALGVAALSGRSSGWSSGIRTSGCRLWISPAVGGQPDVTLLIEELAESGSESPQPRP